MTQEIRLKWLHTSDVHGALFCWDALHGRNRDGGLGAVYAYADLLRQQYPDGFILSDGGDVLQGQPYTYYYNYIDTLSPHLVASCMNALHYDVAAFGNHDIETGHAVFDRWLQTVSFPVVGANIIDTNTGAPYVHPYVMLERSGVRVAVLGMMTPAIPHWLPSTLWEGLRFDEMVSSSKFWVQRIREQERPDLIVGLFHSGYDGGIATDEYQENAVRQVAEQVDGFDLILYGHDHSPAVHRLLSPSGASVVAVGPSANGSRVAEVDIRVVKEDGRVVKRQIEADIPTMSGATSPSAQSYETMFESQRTLVQGWIDQPVGFFTESVCERDAFFGSSAFVDLIHRLQLDLTGADVSFAAPVSFDARIDTGVVRVRDMFSLYKYENFLVKMRLTGQEIKDYLEMSYALWTNQMQSPQDHILLLDTASTGGRRQGLRNFSYNMDSAAGLRYEVDVTKPAGERVHILSMADGTPFDLGANYVVATNSYRANGGGELLTRGAGIPHDQLKERILWSTDRDLRFYFMQYIREQGIMSPQPLHHWRFVPEDWARPALERDRNILFPGR